MFHGPPLPLSPQHSLCELLAHASLFGAIGAWVRGCSHRQHIIRVGGEAPCRVLASPDLGFLLSRCGRILVREEKQPVVLEAAALIKWRALQVATATPYLPGLERLRVLFPDVEYYENTLLVPLGIRGPEEVLASCVAEGIQVTGSRVVYSATTRPPRSENSVSCGEQTGRTWVRR